MKTIDLSQVKNYVEVTTKEISAKQEYSFSTYPGNMNILFAPQGFKFTGEFRKPIEGEYFLSTDFSARKESTQAVRLILKPVTKKKVYIFTETGEFRVPKKDEWFIEDTYITFCSHYCYDSHKIVTREVKEIEE